MLSVEQGDQKFEENHPTFESSQNICRAIISPINPLLKPEDIYNRQCFETSYLGKNVKV
jgi:hypothetical protein